MGAYISLAALAIQILFLAVILGFVGYGLNKIIEAHLASRTGASMKAASRSVRTSPAHASARAKVSSRF